MIALPIALMLSKYPVFPAYLSSDFSQHFYVAQNIAKGGVPGLGQMLLYGDVWMYLAGWIRALSWLSPLVATRLAMSALVLISPLIVYATCKEMFSESKPAVWATAAYVMVGSVWYGMVYNTGLYPNFWGVLSSLVLMAAALRLERLNDKLSWAVFLGAMANALFSHFSVLLALVPTAAYLALKRKWLPSGILASMLVLGALAFPGVLPQLVGFTNTAGGSVPPPTPLSSLLPLPILSSMVAETSANWLGDAGSSVLLSLGLVWFISGTRRRGSFDLRLRNLSPKDGGRLLLSSWFLLCLLFPVYGGSAWRFAFVGLMPLTLMAGWSVSKLMPARISSPAFPRTVFVLGLLLVPAFGSFSNYSVWSSIQSQGQVASQQGSDLSAIGWIAANPLLGCGYTPPNGTYQDRACPLVTSNDFNFLYLPYLVGTAAYYAPTNHVVFNDAIQMSLFSANRTRFIEVSRYGTASVGACDQRFNPGLTLTGMAYPNGTAVLALRTANRVNTTAVVFNNSTRVGYFYMEDGYAEISGSLGAGTGSFVAAIGTVATSPVLLSRHTPGPLAGGVPADFCSPWNSLNPVSMAGWKVVYQDPNVRIWEVQSYI